VALYTTDSGPLPAGQPNAPATGKEYIVTVGAGGNVCARWSNPGVQGVLLDDQGRVVPGTNGGGVGFLVSGLTAGKQYRVVLRHVDTSTSDRTALQINT
jgi:hypothetical protein